MRRTARAGVVALAVAVGLVGTNLVPVASALGATVPPGATQRDRNGDRVVDALERTFADSPPGARIDVLVSFTDVAAALGPAAPSGKALHHARAVAAPLTAAEVRALGRRRDVRLVEPDAPVRAGGSVGPDQTVYPMTGTYATPRDLEPASQWAEDALGLDGDAARDGATTYGPDDLVIAVVDSGIDTSLLHLDGGKVIHGVDLAADRDPTCGAAPTPGADWDELGHGSSVAAIAAGDADAWVYRGLAPAAALVDLKVFDCRPETATSQVAAALEWLLDHHEEHGVDVVNLSLGSSDPTDGTDVLSRLVDQLTASGLIVVAAAGNAGPGAGSVGSPAGAAQAIAVGASNGVAGRVLASYSSRGPTLDGRTKPDVLAPGVGVFAWPTIFGGTSAATPFVAAMAGLALTADPDLRPSGTACDTCPTGVDPASVRNPVADLVRSTAQGWGPPGPDPLSGWGELRGAAVIAAAAGITAPPLTYARHASWKGHASDLEQGEVRAITVDTVGRPVGLSVETTDPDGFGRPEASVEVYDATGAEVAVVAQCDGWCTPPQASWSGHLGGWFTPSRTGRHYVRFRSTAPADHVIDVDGAVADAADAAGPPVVLRTRSAPPLFEGAGDAAVVTLRLGAAPPRPVRLKISTDAGLRVTPTTIDVDATSWSQERALQVTAIDDATANGLHAGALRVTTEGGPDTGATFGQLSLPISDDDPPGSDAVTERVNLTPALGASFGGWDDVGGPIVSADGRFVAFTTSASDLGPADANGFQDVYLRDRRNATTERISTLPTGVPDQGLQSMVTGLSDDGSLVLFVVYGTAALWPGHDRNIASAYVKDRRTGQLQLLLQTADGRAATAAECAPGEDFGERAALSGDGRTAVFDTWCRLVPEDVDDVVDVYVRDLVAGTVRRVASTGVPVDGPRTAGPAIDTSGRFVAHERRRLDGRADLVLLDTRTGASRVVNGDGDGGTLGLNSASPVKVARDGATVGFLAESWVAQVADVDAGTVTSLGMTPQGPSTFAVSLNDMSADGRTAVIVTQDPAITGLRHLENVAFFVDLATGARSRVRDVVDTTAPVLDLSPSGRFLAFASNDPLLVLGDTNAARDAFVTTLPGSGTAMPPAPPRSTLASWHGDGVAVSWARPVTDGGSAVSGYRVRATPAAGGTSTTAVVPGDARAATLTGLDRSVDHVVEVSALNHVGTGDPSSIVLAASQPPPPPPRPPSTRGYWMVTAAGTVHAFGDAVHLGDARLPSAAVDLEPTPSGRGYRVLAADGTVATFGDAAHLGGATLRAGERATSLSATPTGDGYWVFTDLGRAIGFGAAAWFGDMSGVRLNGPVLDSIPTPTGAGYYMVASDGGIFAFGDAAFHGSMGAARLNAPVQSLVPDPDGAGYWLVASDGGVFSFAAVFRGSMGGAALNRPVTGMVAYGDGYLMVGEDGGIFSFSSSPFLGSLGDRPPPSPIVAVAARS